MKSYADAFSKAPNSAREQEDHRRGDIGTGGDLGTLGMSVWNGPGDEEGCQGGSRDPCKSFWALPVPTKNCPVMGPPSCQGPQA